MSTTITPSKSNLLEKDAIAPSNPVADFVQETLAMTRRLFIQLQRRPSTLAAGIISP